MLFRITLDTNPEDCNLHCIMCEEHSEFSDFKQKLFEKTGTKRRLMPNQWIEKIFAEAKKLGVKEIIPSTMGEPLLYQHIDLFFSLARKYEIKINLTTNGTFPKKSVEEWAKLIIPFTTDTKISLNGANRNMAESVMKGLNFDKQIENIRKFIAFRNQYFAQTGFYSRISLQLTFMKNNMPELSEIIKLAAELGVDRVKGHHLWTHFNQIEALSFRKDSKSILDWNTIVDNAIEVSKTHQGANGKSILLENFTKLSDESSFIIDEEKKCPFLGKELWISATGKISPCCAPDEQRNSLGNFGFYPETKIQDVLNSENYTNLVKNYKSHSLCKTCNMRK